jgi:hypothetical protein
MMALIIIGIIAYFVIPLALTVRFLERNDYKVFGIEVDVYLSGLVVLLFEFIIAMQILFWVFH